MYRFEYIFHSLSYSACFHARWPPCWERASILLFMCGIRIYKVSCHFFPAQWLSCNFKWATTSENNQFAYVKTKALISCAVNAQLIRAFVFVLWIAQFLFFLHQKFQTSSPLNEVLALFVLVTRWLKFDCIKFWYSACFQIDTCFHNVKHSEIGPLSIYLGDNCIQIFHLGRYIVGYTVGNFVLRRRVSGAVKHDFRPYIRRYTTPNEKFEYCYPHSNVLFNYKHRKNALFFCET